MSKRAPTTRDASLNPIGRTRYVKKTMNMVINGIDLDLSEIPAPIWSCGNSTSQAWERDGFPGCFAGGRTLAAAVQQSSGLEEPKAMMWSSNESVVVVLRLTEGKGICFVEEIGFVLQEGAYWKGVGCLWIGHGGGMGNEILN
ncbi:Protein Barley B recombinant [Platanthera guangdongensis]|uniref:GAGA-binding transcriptional activator n=1 Tax=Platanthera guangdongensis TaxID=2320717 RepID=A0ABR2MQP5_9ASPA